jgi:hypothetical protein
MVAPSGRLRTPSPMKHVRVLEEAQLVITG